MAVDVIGESPGRLRLAVLDEYEPEGWRQRAEFAVTGEVVTPSEFDDVAGAVPSVVTVAQGPAATGLRATPTAGSPVGVVDPDGVRFAPAAGLFVTTDPSASVRYRSLPRAEAAPPGAVSAPVGVPAELYRCPDSAIIDDIAGVLAQGTTEPLERLNRIESWLKLTKIYDPEAPGGQTVRSVERFLSQEFARGNLEVLVTAVRRARPLRRRPRARRRRLPGTRSRTTGGSTPPPMSRRGSRPRSPASAGCRSTRSRRPRSSSARRSWPASRRPSPPSRRAEPEPDADDGRSHGRRRGAVGAEHRARSSWPCWRRSPRRAGCGPTGCAGGRSHGAVAWPSRRRPRGSPGGRSSRRSSTTASPSGRTSPPARPPGRRPGA